MSKQFSIIIPAFNEEENVPSLLDDINSYFQEIEEVEVVIVDDGSFKELNEYIEVDAYDFELRIIRNKYNLGQSKSIEIGLETINSNLVGLIDSDCQNPPSELRKAYDTYKNNDVDAVVSYRKNRQDDLLRKSISVFANFLLKILTKSKFKRSRF
jgi:glycosyltransferase involved in cell wall biosynthesis